VSSGNDPLAGSSWSRPSTVAGFATGSPNQTLIAFAGAERSRASGHRLLDIGCGAGRNAVPLAMSGWSVLGVDLSLPMLAAAATRAREEQVADRCRVALGSMDHLPVASQSCELIVAHGIWNLARTGTEFRDAVREAARVAAPDAALFVFTFSRDTLAAAAEPVAGESFVFEDAQGERHVFLTANQLVGELHEAGFALDAAVPLREVNPRASNRLITIGSPVIWEGAFRFKATQ
jgi:SAM-dependent methyltransferase